MNILLADDDPDDRLLTVEAMAEVNPAIVLDCVVDGVHLLQRLNSQVLPDLLLLDLNMPRKSGMVALHEIRSSPILQHLPVVILSTSRSESEILDCYQRGANAFMSKPHSYRELVLQLRALADYWFGHSRLPRGLRS